MFIKSILTLASFCAGTIISMGVFSVLIAVDLIPRFAGKTNTARHILLYEGFVTSGIITGDFLSLIKPALTGYHFSQTTGYFIISRLLLILYGLFTGIFVGCLAVSIAEMLDAIPIFARRISFTKGIGIVILAVSLGKLVGSLLYFAQGIYQSSLP